MSLYKKTVSGFFWSALNAVSVQVVNLVIQIILARLLTPNDFGVMAILQVFLVIGFFLMEGGMNTSLIRLKNPTQLDYSTVFYSTILFSTILYLLIFLIAPYIGQFYKNIDLVLLIRVLCLSILIRAFASVQVAVLIKKMDFKRQLLIQMPSVVISGAIAILLAFRGMGIWSLVVFNLLQSIIFTLVYWIVNKWRPSFVFDKIVFKKHFLFGYKIALTNVFNGVFDNIYNLTIGKVYGMSMLSFYNRANMFQLLPGRILSGALENVTYPMFSEIQESDVKLKKVYRRILLIVFFLHSPIMIYLSIVATPFFKLLLTEKWLPIVPYFQILLVAGLFNPLQRYNLNILRIKDKPNTIFYLNLLKKMLLVIAVLLSFKYGIMYLVASESIVVLFSFLIISYYVGNEINYTLIESLRDLLKILVFIISWSVFVFILYQFLLYNHVGDFYILLITFLFSVSSYLLAAFFLKIEQMLEIFDIGKKIFFKK